MLQRPGRWAEFIGKYRSNEFYTSERLVKCVPESSALLSARVQLELLGSLNELGKKVDTNRTGMG